MTIRVLGLFAFLSFRIGQAAVPETITVKEAVQRNLLIYAIRPEFPYVARGRPLTVSGVFDLEFDYESGTVRGVEVVKSAGKSWFDHAAIEGLKQWKVKPRSVHKMRVPLVFTSSR